MVENLTVAQREHLLKFVRSFILPRKSQELPPIIAALRSGPVPLSFAQQRLWFLAQMEGVSQAYHVPFGLRLKGALDCTALGRALNRILARHEALRTTFAFLDEQPVQQIAPLEASRFLLIQHDLREHRDAQAEFDRLRALESGASFDLEHGPLIRGRLIRLCEDEHVLLITMHHIVSDGWSMGVLMNELSALYSAFRLGQDDPLPELQIQYADYTLWQRRWIEGEILQRQAAYWKTALAGVPALLEVPADHARPVQQDFAGGFVGLELDEQLTAGLKELSRRHGTTLYMTLLAAWAALLGRLSGQQDVVIGTPTANRGRAEIENLIGFFVNTLAVRVDLTGSPTVSTLLERVKEQALAAQQHQDIPFEQVVELVQPVRSLSHSPLFQVMFAWQNNTAGTLALPGLQLLPLPSSSHTVAKFDLTLSLQEIGNSIVGGIEYATSLFEQATIERYLGYYRNLLQAMVADDSQAVDRLPVLSAAERHRLLFEWNDTQTDFPSDMCVHQLFEQQVEKTPDGIAVVFEQESLTYAELNRRSNQLAHYLRELGVRPDTHVAICLERGFDMIVALLAVLKAGGAYVPLDPAYPSERLRFMLQDSTPAALLTHRHLQDLFADLAQTLPILHLDTLTPPWQQMPQGNPDPHSFGLSPQHLAYVIYTSGSTGSPKGVMVAHLNLVSSTFARKLTYGCFGHFLLLSPLSFDSSVAGIFGVLTNAGTLFILSTDVLRDPFCLYENIQIHQIESILCVPSLYQQILHYSSSNSDKKSLSRVIIAGEACPRWLVTTSLQNQPQTSLFNEYGPTENTVWASVYRCIKQPIENSIPIGRPIANTQIYILDEHRQPVPTGVAGELYIGGAGVARGYLNRPQLTAERFLADPFSSQPEARMYKTGDLGRWLPDGNIEFLGRNDFQLKMRGYRIELGEIEARLAQHPEVREAVVLARQDAGGDKRLVAYYTSGAGQDSLNAEQLRSHLSLSLPEYMLPAAFVRLDSFPLTPNGKLDRKALPAPEGDSYVTRTYEPPQGETETKLAQIWADVLKLERIGRHDNFFELGGHSLLAVRVISRIHQTLNLEVAVDSLFAHPTLADLARSLQTAAHAELPPITAALRSGPVPLSFAQQRLWFLAQMEGASEAYHIPLGLRLKGDLDRPALRRALGRLVARHEALRTTFAFLDEQPVQRIAAAEDSRFLLIEHDLRRNSDAPTELGRLLEQEAGASFDLEHGPLIRGRLIRLCENEHALLITLHHIVSDGWSMGVLAEELSALYGAFQRGEDDPLPELPIQYADYAVWQRQWIEVEILQQQAAYWKTALDGVPALLELPADHARPAQQDFAGAFAGLALDEQLTAGIKKLSRRHGTTLFMTLLASWAALLARLSGQQDVVIGTPVANRGRAEIEGLIGFFVNTLALRLDLSGFPSVSALLDQVKAQAIAAQQHQDIPFEQVVELVQPVRSLAHSPLFQVMFAWQNAPEGPLKLPGLELQSIGAPHRMAKFDLTLYLQDADGTIAGGIEYATALFEPATIERYAGYFRRLLEAMVADDTQAVDRLPILSDAERHRVLYEWNDTKADFPSEMCLQQLFEEQVLKNPDATAVVFEDESLSYGELNRRANQLAHHLRGLGVIPDSRVAICMERGFEMIVALLGILKAGGAYVPLDPAYPVERLRWILEDSAPAVVLTQGHLQGLLSGLREDLRVIDLSGGHAVWACQSGTNPDPAHVGLTPEHLAYVIYTSGSTGSPKGVMGMHRATINRLSWMYIKYPFEQDEICCAKTSLSFIDSIWELFGPLLKGIPTVLLPSKLNDDLVTFGLTLTRHCITRIVLVPSLLRAFLESHAPGNHPLPKLNYWITSGEPLPGALANGFLKHTEQGKLLNLYGSSEDAADVTYYEVKSIIEGRSIPIGRPIANTQIYILDEHRQPVPIGVAGELYIGGAGVARGYLNRPQLTAERFLADPFSSQPEARMYKTGDLGRWLPDGNIEFLGRNDFQVKMRGYRIELGEIEARLAQHPEVREAVVLARQDAGGDKRLVAYYTSGAGQDSLNAEQLRSHLSLSLPEYMLPAAFVRLDSFPLTPNGKLDRKALPAPEGDSYVTRTYEPPQGETETKLAQIWADVLKLERIGRHDNFFELGGHSLLAVTLIERMRRNGLQVDVRSLFAAPTLAALATTVNVGPPLVEAPPNRIPAGCDSILPEMLPLIELSQEEIGKIVSCVAGGAANVQDIYPLAPLQDGILFHHLMGGDGDPYLRIVQFSFSGRDRLDAYIGALQAVIDRHDILRTAVLWEGLDEPVQVVCRRASLQVEELQLSAADGDIAQQLYARFNPRQHRINVRQAPLLRLYIAYDELNRRWIMTMLQHHLIGDHTTMEVMQAELQAHLLGQADRLPAPLPFRNLVAQARLGVSQQEHEAFFRQLLGDIDEPTAPFGLLEVQGDGSGIEEAHLALDNALARRIRDNARRLGVSPATLCHLAWARVLAVVSGREDVVFGTVLFGRMQGGEGSDRIMGMLINTLPVRIRIDQDGVESSIRRVHSLLARLLRHEHASLALAQRCSAVPAPAPLFSALLNYRHAPGADRTPSAPTLQAWEGMQRLRSEERTNYPFTLSVNDLGRGFSLTAQTPASIGSLRVCEFMRTALESLTDALETAPSTAVCTLDVLSAAERHRLLFEWNDTQTDFPSDMCVHQLFEQQVEKTPDGIAVVFEQESLTYAELNRRSNQLAHYLRELGVRPDTHVAICLERGFDMIVALLAVLKAGGAYVPLDRAYPSERLRFMLQDSTPAALLTHRHLQDLFADLAQTLPILHLDTLTPPWQQMPQGNPDPHSFGLSPQHLAYVIYTSGSTGSPKGVMVAHLNLVSSTFARKLTYGCFGHFLLLSPLSFDSSVAGIFGVLTNAGTLFILSTDVLRDPFCLYENIQIHQIESILCVPSLYQQILHYSSSNSDKKSLSRVIIAGEACPRWLVTTSLQNQPQTSLFNEYGPTENTVWASVYRCIKQPIENSIPIGRPIANTQIYILDEHRQPVPTGVAGELYIGGAGVARGYLNRPQLTAERFLADPFSSQPEARMYKTGDLGRWLPDGNIEFLGRNDFQVKMRGYRIELGEIEARLAQHPEVREAVVLARQDAGGDKRLVAYYTSGAGQDSLNAEQLRSHLSLSLPEYMLPAAFVRLDSFPLTPNGKLDRKALPAPEGDSYVTRTYEPPQGETETKLAQIWADVLKLERIGRHDNFFELGGHSLLAVTLIERMRRNGLQVDVRSLFAAPTLAALATTVNVGPPLVEAPPNRIPAGCDSILPEMLPLIELSQEEIGKIVSCVAGGAANVQDIYPLAPLQDGILFHHLMGGDGDPYLRIVQFSFSGRDRLDAYIGALQAVIDRHDILRTAVLWEGLDEPVQVVCRRASLQVEELQLSAADGDIAQQLYARFNPRQHRINVRQAPLLRLYIAYDELNRRWIMTMLQHHLIGDHTTMEVMQAELQAHLLGQADRLPAPLPFRNLVAQARLGVSQQEHEAFFRQLLGDIDEPTAPFGLLEVQGDGSGIEEAHLALDNALARRIRDNARRLGVSPATLCHLAWARVLAVVSGREDVVFGTVLFGRMQGGEGSDRIMGMLINTLPVRIRIDQDGVESSIRRVHSLLARLLRHEHASLALAQRCSAVPAPAPLFSALLNYRHAPGADRTPSAPTLQAWEGMQRLRSEERTNYPFTLSVNDLGRGFSLTAQTPASIGSLRVCEFMRTALESLTDALETAPSTAVCTLDVLSAAERHRLLFEWNDTQTDFPSDMCVHQLFEQQVEKTPDGIAVVFEQESLTYAELNRRSNQLAHYLRELGVRPDTHVAICLERGFDMIVALLAVLKAGGAYVPLDPAYPSERLRFMLQDSTPAALLTHRHLQDLFADLAQTLPILHLDTLTPPWQQMPQGNPDPHSFGLSPQHLAYVIYTSGSTGSPKGVMVTHLNIVNYVLGIVNRIQLGPGLNFAIASTIATDLGNTVIFPALVTGGCLHVLSYERIENPASLSEYFKSKGVDVLKIVPSHLAALQSLPNPDQVMPKSRLILGGEALRLDWIARLLATAPECEIYNHYGPTETTVGVLTCRVGQQLPVTSSGTLPIGKPLPNTRVYVLDEHLRPVPIGVVGELCIGGHGVARGYLGRPALTAQKFVVDPFSSDSGARMYRTGDRGRYLPDGNIEFLGRIDDQVKIHGYRIEPGEIEAALREHPGVREAVVLAREDEPGWKKLVAYLVPVRWNQPLWNEQSYLLPNGLPIAYLNEGETDYIYEEIFVLQAYLRHGITIKDGDCVLDVGANIGLFTLFATRQAMGLRIFAFEPNPSAFHCLRSNADAWAPAATCFPFGLSNENKTAEMTIFEGFSLLSGFYTDTAAERKVVERYVLNRAVETNGDGRGEEVAAEIGELIVDRFRERKITARLQRLSDVILNEGLERIDLLKINVEKSELDVLRGLNPNDWRLIRQIVIEVDQQANLGPITQLLAQYGFDVCIEQDPLLRETELCYVYAARPSNVEYIIPQPVAEGNGRPLGEEQVLTPAILCKHLKARLPEYMVPAAYVRLGALPLTPTGKLDRKALPPPEADAYGVRGYEAPVGDVEKALGRIWADVLKLERIGRHDNFFELGGHSLLAVRVISLLAQLNITIAPTTLFLHPTLKSLAIQIALKACMQASDEAVLIQTGCNKFPLFLTHCGGGEIIYAPLLAQDIDPQIPIYGLPAQHIEKPQLQTIEEMARRMVHMIRTVQPHGPYHVGGWSFGGVLSFEIATQLLDADQKVEFVGMIDAAYPKGFLSENQPPTDAIRVMPSIKGQMRVLTTPDNELFEGDRKYTHKLIRLAERVAGTNEELHAEIKNIKTRADTMAFVEVVSACKSAGLIPLFLSHLTPIQIQLHFDRSYSYSAAELHYRPRSLPIPLKLFVPDDRKGTHRFLGWDGILPEAQLEIIKVPGTHLTMMENPSNRQILGHAISSLMLRGTQ